jgi:hypothetical protein
VCTPVWSPDGAPVAAAFDQGATVLDVSASPARILVGIKAFPGRAAATAGEGGRRTDEAELQTPRECLGERTTSDRPCGMRSYQWCRPPTCGVATTSAADGGATEREIGGFLPSARSVRVCRS